MKSFYFQGMYNVQHTFAVVAKLMLTTKKFSLSIHEKKEDVTIMFHSGSSSNYPNCKFFTNILHVCKHMILLPYLMWDEKWLLVLMS